MRPAQCAREGLANFVEARADEILGAWRRELGRQGNAEYRRRRPEELATWTRQGVDALVAGLRAEDSGPIAAHARQLGRDRSRQGFAIGDVIRAVLLHQQALRPLLLTHADRAEASAWSGLVDQHFRHLIADFASDFSDHMVHEARSLAQLTAALLDEQQLPDILALVTRHALTLARASGCAVLLDDDDPRQPAMRSGTLPEPAAALSARIGELGLATVPAPEGGAAWSALRLPLGRHGSVFGAVLLARRGEPFSASDRRALTPFVNQGAVAIEHARLRQEQARLAAQEERLRLSRELHDSVNQSLYGVSLSVTAAGRLLAAGRTEDARAELESCGDGARSALREMRRLIHDLRPAPVRAGGLVAALRERLAVVEQRAGMSVRLELQPPPPLSVGLEEALYRSAIEALNNSLRHAKAKRLTVTLAAGSDGAITLTIADDGCGFAPDAVAQLPGLGLRGIRERLAPYAGELSVDSEAGVGTTLRLSVPLPTEATLSWEEEEEP